jgi:hypothetical protein
MVHGPWFGQRGAASARCNTCCSGDAVEAAQVTDSPSPPEMENLDRLIEAVDQCRVKTPSHRAVRRPLPGRTDS